MGADSAISSPTSLVKKTIDLSDSKLENAEKIPRIESISAINLSKNLIVTIPSSLTYYSNLSRLDLSHNKITTLANIANMPQLQGGLTDLGLANNELTELPQEITTLKNLKFLSINNNKLEKLSTDFGQFPKIRGVSVAGNKFTLTSHQMDRLFSLMATVRKNNIDKLRKTAVDDKIGQWPTAGEISIKDLVFTHHSKPDVNVISNLSVNIKAGERVGIVGRTGSGKSTFGTLFFRLVEPKSGTISIDGAGLEVPDEELWIALEKVGLKSLVSQFEEKLEYKLLSNGSNLSVGQGQLFVLSENAGAKTKSAASSSVDGEADRMIQNVLANELPNTTIISVAHRLNTIADNDKIMVLEQGIMVEYDTPYNLLKNPLSTFSKLVDASGNSNGKAIREIAESKHHAISK
ncbi:Canalicular multispecific organic anion transporter 2 [Boothiomyces sp. JEL0866]|nr:Canalicular multispecific organic anion transporter 2 [Boothiomyces sp. JEL0866]